jgi:MtN3 and saliva related transmembrane protein
MVELIGWLSSAILLATLARQVRKQWREQRVEGVSRWLFIGQTTASLGFTTYSVLVRNWVFTVTNGLILLNAIVGLVLTQILRRRLAGDASRAGPSRARTA